MVIFHVDGANKQYEQIIQNIRSRTATEVLMQLDHVAAQWPQEQPDEKADKDLNVSSDGKAWAFDVRGSVTGPDGSGRSDQQFTRRVVVKCVFGVRVKR